ncbi:alpha/beta hydrolase [Granulicella sp. WH15]|uniref:alpha/beta hydrolase n=1 Tax=Granulicella sp. WH15 TaxID=2602070 RepID=UPI0013668CE7|nr:alpha/beta hydrolase [Granulicella sp. WH15]QHN02089.1 alpha/beta hydrolase [Granulicella sp. WH15]
MLAANSTGTGSPTLILMHFLGGSAREWQEVVAALGPQVHTVAVDLPGFGDSAHLPGYTVTEMADAVAELIDSLHLERYLLVGHSLSGKVAAVLAARRPTGLEGIILIAPSPPGPEPMAPGKREKMLAAFGALQPDDHLRARAYVTKYEERILAEDVLARATEDVLRMNRAAWTAWIERGSLEDWSARVGTLTLPTLLVTGDRDTSLGLAIQQQTTLSHFPNAITKVVAECGHLVPMEKPHELATLIAEFLATLSIPQPYLNFIHSDRVSPRTRELLLERTKPRSATPRALTEAQMTTLRAVVARVIPQQQNPIDLAGFIDERLAAGHTDGWRYDVLPPDREAYAASLDALAAQSFSILPAADQDAILHQIAATPSAQARWFEDLRADAVKFWMAHPQTLARIGYSGIGIGGAHTPHAGFVTLDPGTTEPWEPAS